MHGLKNGWEVEWKKEEMRKWYGKEELIYTEVEERGRGVKGSHVRGGEEGRHYEKSIGKVKELGVEGMGGEGEAMGEGK